MKKPTLQHRLEYALTVAVESGLAFAGRGTAERVGGVLGGLTRRLGVRARVVEENLRLAFPDSDDAWIARTVRATYRHLGREAAAMLRLSTLDAARIRETVVIPGPTRAKLDEALAEGRGVLLATGHYGNWELAAAAVAARGIPIVAVVKSMSNPLVNARIAAARAALGVETVEIGDAGRQVPRALLRGKGVGIVADQDARGIGIFVPFFGIPASTHRGPAHFALRVGAPLFAAVARRMPDGSYLLDGDRIDTRPSGDFDADVRRITAALAAHLEGEIRKDPAQYFWFHKRWKTRPPEEPHSPLTGTTTFDGRGD
jgi:Kdo2-lipid IVA lauroyltransferase/acyltransferase